MKHLRLLSLLAAGLVLAVSAIAQQMPPIPIDSKVKIGKLENGLTYYIQKNEYPKGQAEFFIAQKVGSILEDDSQRGLAHFLEHMCFNGTKHFPGNQIITWCESVGIKFGYNLNAYTSIDQTVYNISAVPTTRESVQDSCLLILHDWANDLLLTDEDIDKERGVIHEEWRRSNNAALRIYDKVLPIIYPNSRYGYRLPIGIMEVVDNFKYQTLRDYYETWYRPDLQGIMVVGDIDPARIEAKIKEYFNDITMPENPKERVYYPVDDNDEPIIAIGVDKEQTASIVDIMIKHDATKPEDKFNLDYLLEKYLVRMVSDMLNARYDEITTKADAPFGQAGCTDDNFFLAKTKDAFSATSVPKTNDPMPSLKATYREILRAARHGFTATEYVREQEEILSQLEKRYSNRDQTTSSSLVNKMVNHFLDNEPLMAIEDEYQMIKMVLPNIPVEAVNSLLPQIVTGKNMVVLLRLPESAVIPTEDQVKAALKEVEAENIEAYVDNVKTEPLIPSLPAKGSVVSEKALPEWDATEWTLSNGAKVIFKTTDFKDDEIVMYATAPKGTSVYGKDDDYSLNFMAQVMDKFGMGTFTSNDMVKYLAGKQVSCSYALSDYFRALSGTSTKKDLTTLFEMIHMRMKEPILDANEYESTKSLLLEVIKNQSQNPQFVFQSKLLENMVESGRKQLISEAIINGANRERIVEIIKEQYTKNAGEFTFVFCGSIDKDNLKALVEQYIASLPGKAVAKEEPAIRPDLEYRTGVNTFAFKQKMETPQTYAAIAITGHDEFSAKNALLCDIAGSVLTERLLKEIREERGATYSIGCNADVDRLDNNNYSFMVVFPMKPEMKDECLKVTMEQFDNVQKSVAPEELNKAKEYYVKNYTEALRQNGSWASMMGKYQLKPVDSLTPCIDIVNNITAQEVSDFLAKIVKQGNCLTVVMDPAE